MRAAVLAVLLFAGSASAESELYLDVGLGRMWGLSQLEGRPRPGVPPDFEEVPAPHATVEVGYSFGEITIFALHTSSLGDSNDRGLEMVGVKYRFSVRLQ